MNILLGFDIGGTKLGIGLGTEDGKLLGTARRDNRNTDPAEVLPWMAAEATRLVKEAGASLKDVAAFGISAPFPAGWTVTKSGYDPMVDKNSETVCQFSARATEIAATSSCRLGIAGSAG